MTTAQGLTDLAAIAFRDYGFVDHVELIPPSQLLRVTVPPTRQVSVRGLSGASFSSKDFTTVII